MRYWIFKQTNIGNTVNIFILICIEICYLLLLLSADKVTILANPFVKFYVYFCVFSIVIPVRAQSFSQPVFVF